MSKASADSKDTHTIRSPDSATRQVNSTNLLKAARFANREGDSQEPFIRNLAVFGKASSSYAFFDNTIDATRYDGISGGPHDEHVGELHTTLLNVKPNAWSNLIYLALKQAAGHQMSLQEIYTWMIEHTDKVKNPNDKAWKKNVRHNLSTNGDFVGVPTVTTGKDWRT